MFKAAHLTEDQVDRFQHRTLETAELSAVDEHLAVCGQCRDRLGAQMRSFEEIQRLRTLLSEHLNYDQTVMAAEGREETAVRQHLAECAICRSEVEDLRQFQSQLKAAPRKVEEMPVRRRSRKVAAYLAIAAGLVLTLSVTLRLLRTEAPAVPAAQVAKLAPAQPAPSEAALPPDQQAAVQLALASHTLERAPVLEGLIGKRGVLLGAPGEQKNFSIRAPLGTVVLGDRPVFRWEAVSGAGSYVVAVFDDRFRKVAESPAVTATEWTPEQQLVRGRVYNWQVTAQLAGKTVRSPVPPAPEARFQVAGTDAVAQVESARREHPGNHLLLAVLLARAGALDEASQELDALAGSDPANAESLRRSLRAMRTR